MRRGIQGFLATFAVAFASTLAFHACDENGFNPGIIVSALENGTWETPFECGTDECDGDLVTKTIITGAASFGSDSTYVITINGTSYTYNSSGDGSTNTIDAALVDCINEGGCGQASGSDVVTATLGSVIIKGITPDTDFTVSTGGSGEMNAPDDVTLIDAVALFRLIYDSLADYISPFELLDAADADETLPEIPSEGEFTVRITGTKETVCPEDGSVEETATMDILFNDGVFDGITFSLRQFDFMGCEVTADLLGNGGAQTVVLDGSFIEIFTWNPAAEEGEWRSFGNLTLDTDDGGSNPFWGDSLNFNMRETFDGTDTYNGGICVNGNVVLGPDPIMDTDDDCDANGTFFISDSGLWGAGGIFD